MSLSLEKIPGEDLIHSEDNLHISSYLKSCRLQKKIELSSVSKALRISQDYLMALEGGDIKRLPERVYTLGFVRSYARFLDLDIENTLDRFKLEILGDACQPTYSLPIPINENTKPNRWLIVLSTVLGLGILITWFFFLNDGSHSEKSLPIPSAIKKELENVPNPLSLTETSVEAYVISNQEKHPVADPAKETRTTVMQNEKKTEIAQSMSENLSDVSAAFVQTPIQSIPQNQGVENIRKSRFLVTEPTWVEVKDLYGHVLEKKIFQKGDYLPVYAFETELTVGNAGGILVQDGTETRPLGKLGAVIRRFRVIP